MHRPILRQKGPFEFVQEESTFIDSQELRLQERPEDLPPGQLPRTLNVKLVGTEIVDLARPEIHSALSESFAQSHRLVRGSVNSALSYSISTPTHSKFSVKEPESQPPTPEEEEKIMQISKDPSVHRKIISSIAPSIYGYEHIKEAIMYLLFGGVSKAYLTSRSEGNERTPHW